MEDVKFDPDEGIITKDGLDFPKTEINFKFFLRQKHFELEPLTLDDDLSDAFDIWLVELDVQELIDYGQQYAEKISLIR